jgi:IS30 family transposase
MGDARNNLAFEKSVQVLLLAQNGASQRTIAYHLNMNQSTVSRILRRHRETGRHTRRPGQGRK